jgi:hypothetical protein
LVFLVAEDTNRRSAGLGMLENDPENPAPWGGSEAESDPEGVLMGQSSTQ